MLQDVDVGFLEATQDDEVVSLLAGSLDLEEVCYRSDGCQTIFIVQGVPEFTDSVGWLVEASLGVVSSLALHGRLTGHQLLAFEQNRVLEIRTDKQVLLALAEQVRDSRGDDEVGLDIHYQEVGIVELEVGFIEVEVHNVDLELLCDEEQPIHAELPIVVQRQGSEVAIHLNFPGALVDDSLDILVEGGRVGTSDNRPINSSRHAVDPDF